MKVVINNEKTNYKPLEITECFFTGKHNVKYDGVNAEEQSKNSFSVGNSKSEKTIAIKGHQLWGVTANVFNNNVNVVNKLTWYEIVLSVLVFAPCLIFSWVGAIFGLILGCVNFFAIRLTDSLLYKVLFSVLFLIIALLLGYIFGVFVFKMYFFFM